MSLLTPLFPSPEIESSHVHGEVSEVFQGELRALMEAIELVTASVSAQEADEQAHSTIGQEFGRAMNSVLTPVEQPTPTQVITPIKTEITATEPEKRIDLSEKNVAEIKQYIDSLYLNLDSDPMARYN